MLVLMILGLTTALAVPSPHNILLILADDLRPQIRAYGHKFMSTPHLDALSARATVFQNAYVQYAFCAPSRNSFMTGRRPDATQAFSFMDHFREKGVGDKWISMPEYFRDHGYATYGVGKLFHPGLPPSFDARKSWDEFIWSSGEGPCNATFCHTTPIACNGTVNGWPVLEPDVTNVKCLVGGIGLGPTGCGNDTGAVVATSPPFPLGKPFSKHLWCAIDTSRLGNDGQLVDDVTAAAAEAFLDRAATNRSKPFYLGVGFHKPHTPYNFPAHFLDLYPAHFSKGGERNGEKAASCGNATFPFPGPLRPMPPRGMPLCAWHDTDDANASWGAPTAPALARTFRRAYYAAVSYVDSNIGRVLDKVEQLNLTQSTAVLFMGDHGYQLGEMNLWHKQSNFELAVRVPLIVACPWCQTTIHSRKSAAVVEAVDIYPTLTSLAGLPPPAGLQGSDFSSLLFEPAEYGRGVRRWSKEYAFSQFAKRNQFSKELNPPQKVAWNVCTTCNRSMIDVQGYSVRSVTHRYTEWFEWNQTTNRPIWDRTVGVELYDHAGDDGSDFDRATPAENLWKGDNVSTRAADRQVAKALTIVLRGQFQNDHLPTQRQSLAGN